MANADMADIGIVVVDIYLGLLCSSSAWWPFRYLTLALW